MASAAPRGERCVRDRGEPMGTIWWVHGCLGITTRPCQGIYFPGVPPVIQPRSPICLGTSPPMLFSAPKGAQAPPCSPWEWNWGCSHHPAPGCSCCLGFAREVLLMLGSPISMSPRSPPGPAGDLVGLCWASPALIQALNQADEGCCRVGGHQQPPPCSLSILGGTGPTRFPPPRPPHHLWPAN